MSVAQVRSYAKQHANTILQRMNMLGKFTFKLVIRDHECGCAVWFNLPTSADPELVYHSLYYDMDFKNGFADVNEMIVEMDSLHKRWADKNH